MTLKLIVDEKMKKKPLLDSKIFKTHELVFQQKFDPRITQHTITFITIVLFYLA
jgi:hypothetical protein